MYKEGKWAKQILDQQDERGLWGPFHTLANPVSGLISTEQAIQRLEILGYTINDPPIQKTIDFMNDCILRKKEMPDKREKSHNWDLFSDLMFAAWIRRFTKDLQTANTVASKWAEILTESFKSGRFSQDRYNHFYEKIFMEPIRGPRFLDFMNFYHVSLLTEELAPEIEGIVLKHMMNYETGIYYCGYQKSLNTLPALFQSKETTRFLASIELIARYKSSGPLLGHVQSWIEKNSIGPDMWDLGPASKDSIHLPLSDSWRSKENRILDSTCWINRILTGISD